MQAYAEQSIINENIDKRQRRTKIIYIMRYIFVAVIIIIFFLFWTAPLGDGGWMNLLFTFLFYVSIAIPFILGIILLTRFVNKTNSEYDYYLNDGIFRVVKIINRKKRKKLLEVNISSFESVGRVTSDNYDRYASNKNVKKVFAICSTENEDEIFYLYYIIEGIPYLVHIQPDEPMIIAIRRSVSRFTVMDKSANIPVKSNDIS